jgi:hypothetical protein
MMADTRERKRERERERERRERGRDRDASERTKRERAKCMSTRDFCGVLDPYITALVDRQTDRQTRQTDK